MKTNYNKWKNVFPEIKDKEELVRYFEIYIEPKDIFENKREDTHCLNKDNYKKLENIIDKDCPFQYFVIWFVEQYYDELVEKVQNYNCFVNVEKVVKNVIKYIASKIVTIVIRTFIEEVHKCEEENKLFGNTDKEKYDYYNEQLSISDKYISYMEHKYPVLFQMTHRLIQNQLLYVVEILKHISEDKDEVSGLFFNEDNLGKVEGLKFGLGDSHNKGKTVVEIECSCGNIIYKPRNLDVENNWFRLVTIINQSLKKKVLRAAKVINKKDYGFMEKVIHEECDDVNDIEEFYYHSGCLLAVLHSLNASDCHFENIISAGKYPIVVDAELLLTINPNEREDDKSSIEYAVKTIYYSVSHVGLLPFQVSVGNKKMDIGGIKKVKNQIAPVKSLVIKNKGSIKIHIEYEDHIIKNNNNVPSACDNIGQNKCISNMIRGFDELYDFILDNKNEYRTKIMELFQDTSIRVLFNPTMFYSNLLGISYHPMFMESNDDRYKVLSRIGLINKDNISLVKSEINMLFENDIPYYFIKFKDKYIKSGNGGEQLRKNIFSPREVFDRKLNELSQEDKNLQIEILKDSFYRFDFEDNLTGFSWSENREEISKLEMIKMASDILDYLYKVRSFSGKTKNNEPERCFIGSTILNMDNDNWNKGLLDFDLYDGHIGIVYLYWYAAKVVENKKYLQISIEVLNMIIDNMKLLINNDTVLTGLHKGIGGYVYVLGEIFQRTKDEVILNLLMKFLKLGQSSIDKNNNTDFIGGNIGFILAVFRVREYNSNADLEKLLNIIIGKFEESILENSSQYFVKHSGYAHGIASIVVALYKVYQYTGNMKLRVLVEQLLDYDRRTFKSIEDNNWFRSIEEKEFSRAWCHGSPGILYGRIQLKGMGYSDSFIDQEIKNLINLVKKDTFGYNLTFCHGDLGNLYILLQTAVITGDKELSKLVYSNFNRLYRTSLKNWRLLKRPVEKLDGLMAGLGGIAFALLYFADEDKKAIFI